MSVPPGISESNRAHRFLTNAIWRTDNRNRLSGALVIVAFLTLVLTSCSSPNENRTPVSRVPQSNFRSTAPSETPTLSPLPSATPTLEPTLGPIVLPTPPANGVTLALAPDQAQTGWVASGSEGIFTADNNLNAGILKGQIFESIVQFDLSSLAPGTRVLYAALELSGRNGNDLGTQGQWNLDVLDTDTSEWNNATYDTVSKIPALFTLGKPLSSNDLVAGKKSRFELTPDQLALLHKQVDRGHIAIRLSGPTEEDDNLFIWDGTPGEQAPTLYLVAVPAAFTVITTTPTPADVFAAATRMVAQTLRADRFGTPTPLPRSMATETPLPYVVYTDVPTPANPAAASATAAFMTAVALTTGTPTPLPRNWFTATPPPIAIPFASITAAPTVTSTLAPVWPPDLAKQPLPAALYNKIAFLSGDRSNPTAWIIDPDGSNLAELTNRTYYDIAAARDTISPDGTWLLYNAPDTSARQILQIWRTNLKSPNSPPEQLTFHTRGISFAAVWSPDGTKYAYTSTKDGREQEIFMYDFNDPKRWIRLTFIQEMHLWNQYPSYSPDGTQISFSSDRGHIAAYTEIWVMNADGSGSTKLGDGSRDAWAPVWIKWTK